MATFAVRVFTFVFHNAATSSQTKVLNWMAVRLWSIIPERDWVLGLKSKVFMVRYEWGKKLRWGNIGDIREKVANSDFRLNKCQRHEYQRKWGYRSWPIVAAWVSFCNVDFSRNSGQIWLAVWGMYHLKNYDIIN